MRSTLLCSRVTSSCKAGQITKSQFKTVFCASQLRKAGNLSLPKKEESLVFSYTGTGKDVTTLSRAVSLSQKGVSSMQHFIQVWFYIKREQDQASKQALLVYRKAYILKAGYYLSIKQHQYSVSFTILKKETLRKLLVKTQRRGKQIKENSYR